MLALPGFLYFLLKEGGKNRYKPLPFFGTKQVAKTYRLVRGKQVPDTIYHQVDSVHLLNQDRQPIWGKQYKGKILLVNLFYTNAKGQGIQAANKAMKGFSKIYQKNDLLQLLSVNVDANEMPKNIKKYSDSLQINPKKWQLATGDSLALQRFIKQGLLLDAVKVAHGENISYLYSNAFVLLDSQRRLRGYYDITNAEAKSKLEDEIKVLIAEELRNIKDGR